ncbi:predicted protein, partial [Naegleria gruberi]
MAIVPGRTATIASLMIIVLWYCLCTQHSIEASKPVIGVVSTVGTEDNFRTLFDSYPNYFGYSGYWGIFNGFQSGTIFFNEKTKLDGLNPSFFVCLVWYAWYGPPNEIIAKECIYSSKQLEIFSPTASVTGPFVTVRNAGSVEITQFEQKITFPPGSFILRLCVDPAQLAIGVYVVHSADKFVAWSSITSLADNIQKIENTLIVVGYAECSNSQENPDILTFEDKSVLTLPTQCDLTPFAALVTVSLDSMTLGKKQVLQQGGTGTSVIKKVIKSSASSFWVCGSFHGEITFGGDQISAIHQTPFFSYYEINSTNIQPFKVKHTTTIANYQNDVDVYDMKIITAQGKVEIYIVGSVVIPTESRKSFLMFYLKNGTNTPTEAKNLVIDGDVVFTGIDTNKNDQEIIVSGHFAGTIQIGSTKLTSTGGRDIVIAAFKRTTLDAVWAIKEGGSKDDYSYGVKNNNNQFISIFGTLGLNPKFDGKNVSVSTASNGFVAYLTDPNYCYGIASNSETVCNGHGQCQEDGSCLCSSGFGDQCQFPTCNEIHFNEPNVCNGYGNCTSYDNCSCNAGWSGQYCTDFFTCYSIASYNSS